MLTNAVNDIPAIVKSPSEWLPIFMKPIELNQACVHGTEISHLVVYLIPVVFVILYMYFSGISKGQVNNNPDVGFSNKYLAGNLRFYLSTLLGGKTKYLWFSNPYGWPVVLWTGLLGVAVALFNKKTRQLAFLVCILIFSLVLFMSFFYYPDARYIQVLLPLILLFSLCLISLLPLVFSRIFILGLFAWYMFVSVKEWRYQIVLNIKYAEVPWNYIGIKEVNKYIEHSNTEGTVVFSFMPRYMFYYFSNKNYAYEPLLPDGRFDIDVNAVGKVGALLSNGSTVYVTEAYMGNQRELSNKTLQDLKQNYNFEKVVDGCYSTCNLYKLDRR